MNSTEKLVDDILEDRVKINDLDLAQMEAVIDFMREDILHLVKTCRWKNENSAPIAETKKK